MYNVNRVRLSGNIVKIRAGMTKASHHYYAFITFANHQGGYTNFLQLVAYRSEARFLSRLHKGDAIEVLAHVSTVSGKLRLIVNKEKNLHLRRQPRKPQTRHSKYLNPFIRVSAMRKIKQGA